MAASRGAGQGPSVRPEAGLAAVPLRGRPLPAWPRGVSSARPPQALRGRPVLSPYEAPSLSRTYCTHSCPLSMAGRPPRLTPLPPGEWLTCSAILSSVPPPPLQTPQARAHRCRITDAPTPTGLPPTEPELEPKKPPAARQASRLACALPRRFFSLLRARGDCGRGRRHGTPAQRTSIRSLSARDTRDRGRAAEGETGPRGAGRSALASLRAHSTPLPLTEPWGARCREVKRLPRAPRRGSAGAGLEPESNADTSWLPPKTFRSRRSRPRCHRLSRERPRTGGGLG